MVFVFTLGCNNTFCPINSLSNKIVTKLFLSFIIPSGVTLPTSRFRMFFNSSSLANTNLLSSTFVDSAFKSAFLFASIKIK